MQAENLPVITEEEETFLDQPYGGLFGNSVIASVVEELIADPTMDYRPAYLQEITGKSHKSIYTALKKLLDLGLIERKSGDEQHPVYRVRIESKKFVALSFLAYAMLDDRGDSDCMNFAIHKYYNSVLREKFEPRAIGTIEKYRVISSTGNDEEKTNIRKNVVSA